MLLQLHALIPHRYFSQSSQGYTGADAFGDTYSDLSDSMDALVHSVMSSIPINDTLLDEIRAIMSPDPQSLELKRTFMNSWPDNQRDFSPFVKEFWNFCDELSVANYLIVKGNRIFVAKEQML